MSASCSRPVQILYFLIFLLFFLNFMFNERYGNRGMRTEQIARESKRSIPDIEEKIQLKGYLSSKLATTSRLANHIFELVSIYGISKKLRRKPAIFVEDDKYTRLIRGIQKIFPGLLKKFEVFEKPPPAEARRFLLSDICCKYDDPDKLGNITDEYLHLTGHFYQSWKYFDGLRDEVLGFVKPVDVDFSPLPKSDETNFITCVHIRRGDFVDGHHHASNEKFVRAAVEFIENNEKVKSQKDVKFLTVIMGDNADFEEKIFPNITIRARKGAQVTDKTKVFVSDNTPQNDLAYSRYHCDAALDTAPSSTFGWWIGYLSKGQTVYYQDIKSTKDVNYMKGVLKPEDFFPPRWTAINMDSTGKIVTIA